jgi:hypothetical protein
MHPTNVPSWSRAFSYVPPTADIKLGLLLCTPIKRWPSKATAPSPSLLFFVDLFRQPNHQHGTPPRVSPQPRVLPDSPSISCANFYLIVACIRKTAATFKDPSSPSSLYFLIPLFSPPPSKRTNDSKRNPDSSRPPYGVGERRHHDLLVPLLYPWRVRG